MSRPPHAASEVYYMAEKDAKLWVSDIEAARDRDTDYFDAVVTVCQDNVGDDVGDGCAYSYFNMSDGETGRGGDSSYKLFERAVDHVRMQLRSGHDTLVHCHVGRSRSVSVCAAAIAALTHRLDVVSASRRVDGAYDCIRDSRDIDPKPTLREHAIRYVEENG